MTTGIIVDMELHILRLMWMTPSHSGRSTELLTFTLDDDNTEFTVVLHANVLSMGEVSEADSFFRVRILSLDVQMTSHLHRLDI